MSVTSNTGGEFSSVCVSPGFGIYPSAPANEMTRSIIPSFRRVIKRCHFLPNLELITPAVQAVFPNLPFLPFHWSRHSSLRGAHSLDWAQFSAVIICSQLLPIFLFSFFACIFSIYMHLLHGVMAPTYKGFWSTNFRPLTSSEATANLNPLFFLHREVSFLFVSLFPFIPDKRGAILCGGCDPFFFVLRYSMVYYYHPSLSDIAAGALQLPLSCF